jgi:hypothetical protein
MTTINSLDVLAARVEAADGPDRKLDLLIAKAAGHVRQQAEYDYALSEYETAWAGGLGQRVPEYTASLDAAMTLIPDDMRDEIEITTLYQVARVTINMNHGPDGSPFYGSNKCNSIPLALCAAALRARSHLEKQ